MSKYRPLGFASYPAQNMRAPSLPASFTGRQETAPRIFCAPPASLAGWAGRKLGVKKGGKEILQLKKNIVFKFQVINVVLFSFNKSCRILVLKISSSKLE
jgi:hypothetical protein